MTSVLHLLSQLPSNMIIFVLIFKRYSPLKIKMGKGIARTQKDFTKRLSTSLLKKKIFLMWTIFEVFIEFVTTLLLFFMLWFFGHEARRILAP